MENVSINFTIELPELTQDWGNRLLESINRTWCTPGPRRKEQRILEDTNKILCTPGPRRKDQ